MAHTVIFEQFDNFKGIITHQDIIDAIDLFFDGPDSKFTIIGFDCTPGRRGSCAALGEEFKITLCRSTIEAHMYQGLRMGGNKTHANLKAAVMSVFAHELQHANQDRRYRNQAGFWSGQYINRPCERDARRFADENEDIIAQILDLDGELLTTKKKKPEIDHQTIVEDTVDVFSFIEGDIWWSDVVKELEIHGAYNSVNVDKICSLLESKGKIVIRD